MDDDLSKAVLDALEPFARAGRLVPTWPWVVDSDKIGIVGTKCCPIGITVADLRRLPEIAEKLYAAQRSQAAQQQFRKLLDAWRDFVLVAARDLGLDRLLEKLYGMQ